MPKSRTRTPKGRTTSPADRRRRRIENLIDDLAKDYAAWAVAEAGAADGPAGEDLAAFSLGQLDIVKVFYLFLGFDDRPVVGLRIDPQAVPEALDALLDTDDVDDLRYYLGTLIDWLSFLEETERWEGSAADLEAITELLDSEAESLGGIVDASPGEGTPRREPTEEESLAFATSSPLVRHARALLDFVGTSRTVGADGKLTPSDALEAATLIGDGAADPARRLSRLWSSLVNAEIIEVDGGAVDGGAGASSTARPGEDAARLGTGDMFGRLEAQFLTTEFVIATCASAGEGPQGESVGGGLGAILQRAAVEDPLDLASVESLAEDAPDGADPAALETVSALLLDELRELAALGVADLRKGLADLHTAALDAVYDAFEAPDGDEDWDDEDWAD